MRTTVAVAAALAVALPAAAQQRVTPESCTIRTTGDLVRLCTTPATDPQHAEALGWCHGYGRGALDYHRAATPANAAPLFCVPAPSPLPSEVLRRFVAWGNANPAAMSAHAVEGVFRFLFAPYPCPRG